MNNSDLIRKLGIAENQFLEILISKFLIDRQGQGSNLNIFFTDDTPAIWTKMAKYEVQKSMPDFPRKAIRYQEELDNLKVALEALEFDDLGGLSEIESPEEEHGVIGSISQEDLDDLKEALEALAFEDLGGLSG